ncbi:methyltransferase domain-containing protein [Okeania sp. SIO2B3]|uniref:methyltransferase domain-containing protein n=1 Tax=Okeania sp. SIO2B3 TaxID=2607784 RepID=UPI0013BFD41A|nr:methyltransferase domain-containing protein [Okeania sp. SIO2B3]NET45680.1 class I SAM-dependent methyltransferase [Okeania sp. SIO2B3]
MFLSADRIEFFQKEFNIARYQFQALKKLHNLSDGLVNKTVLEIGGSNLPRELILNDLECKKWVSVDVIPESHYALKKQTKHYQQEKVYSLKQAEKFICSESYIIFNGFAENIPNVFDNYFDVVFSVASFEHIGRLQLVVQKIFESLKMGGLLYSRFGPIFSCCTGHHINFQGFNENIPEFAHLLMRPFNLLKHLRNFYDLETASDIIYRIYFSERINRLFYEDYEACMALSSFNDFKCTPFGIQAVPMNTLAKLSEVCPWSSRFDAYGMEIVAYKTH